MSTDVSETTSQLYFLSLLLNATKPSVKDLEERANVSRKPFDLGDECTLFEERREDAERSYEVLKQLHTKHEVSFAVKYLGKCVQAQ